MSGDWDGQRSGCYEQDPLRTGPCRWRFAVRILLHSLLFRPVRYSLHFNSLWQMLEMHPLAITLVSPFSPPIYPPPNLTTLLTPPKIPKSCHAPYKTPYASAPCRIILLVLKCHSTAKPVKERRMRDSIKSKSDQLPAAPRGLTAPG